MNKKLWVAAMAATLAACGGGSDSTDAEVDTLRSQVAAQQSTIATLNQSLAAGQEASTHVEQLVQKLQATLAVQQQAIDDLLARLSSHANVIQAQQQDMLSLRATIVEQQRVIDQLLAGAEKVDTTGPVIQEFKVSRDSIVMPDTVVLTAQVVDAGSGVLKVEFYEAGKSTPVAIDTAPPYVARIPLGVQDAGVHSYYVRVYDMATNAHGAVVPNVVSNAEAALRVDVAIPANGLDAVGSLKADFGVEGSWISRFMADPHRDGTYYALTNDGQSGNLLKIDYAAKSAAKVAGATDSTLDLAFHPAQRDLVFRLTDTALQSSADAGATWKTLATKGWDIYGNSGVLSYDAHYLAFAPSGKKLFIHNYSAGSGGWSSSNWSLGFSEDGGATWTRSLVSGSQAWGMFGPVAASAGDENLVFAGNNYGGLLRSSDGGRNFMPAPSLPVTTSPYSNTSSLVKEWPGLPSRRLSHASNSQR